MGFDVPFIVGFVIVATVVVGIIARGVLRLVNIKDPPADTPNA